MNQENYQINNCYFQLCYLNYCLTLYKRLKTCSDFCEKLSRNSAQHIKLCNLDNKKKKYVTQIYPIKSSKNNSFLGIPCSLSSYTCRYTGWQSKNEMKMAKDWMTKRKRKSFWCMSWRQNQRGCRSVQTYRQQRKSYHGDHVFTFTSPLPAALAKRASFHGNGPDTPSSNPLATRPLSVCVCVCDSLGWFLIPVWSSKHICIDITKQG